MTDAKVTIKQVIEWLQQIPEPERFTLLIRSEDGKLHKAVEMDCYVSMLNFGERKDNELDWRIYNAVIISYEKDEA